MVPMGLLQLLFLSFLFVGLTEGQGGRGGGQGGSRGSGGQGGGGRGGGGQGVGQGGPKPLTAGMVAKVQASLAAVLDSATLATALR